MRRRSTAAVDTGGQSMLRPRGVWPVLVACLLALGQTPVSSAQELVAKGRELFNDTKLSADGKWSCATCHPNTGHTDNKTYVGVEVVKDGDPKGRSTPTLW